VVRPEGAPSGERVIFWLFCGLACFTAFTLIVFSAATPVQFRARVYASLVADLGMPLIAWQALKAIAQSRARHAQTP
jgi:hypothetical protein